MAVAILFVLLSASALVATNKVTISEGIQCVCTSTHFGDISFSVKCQRNSTGPTENGLAHGFAEDSSVSCERGPQPEPRKDYSFYDRFGHYKFHPRQTNWNDALRTCAREGANLLVVRSQSDAEAVISIFKDYPKLHEEDWLNDQIWIGATDLEKEGRFITLTGITLQEEGYERWAEYEPSNDNDNEHCLAIDRKGLFNDEPCEINLAFLCRRVVV